MSSSTNPDTPHPSGPYPTDPPSTDPRLYVAALLELRSRGWHVSEIRPDRDAPVLWRVVIVRYDRSAWITVIEADPDDALAELLRYAAADAEPSTLAAAAEGPGEPSSPDAAPAEHTPDAARHGPEEP